MNTYAADTKYIANLTTADAAKLAQHGNPKLRDHVAPILLAMAKRHANSEYSNAQDAQSCDAIMFYTNAAEIRIALGEKE